MFDDRVKWLKTQKSFGQSASEQIHAKIKVSLCPKSQKKKKKVTKNITTLTGENEEFPLIMLMYIVFYYGL